MWVRSSASCGARGGDHTGRTRHEGGRHRGGERVARGAERMGPAIQQAAQAYPLLRRLYELYASQGEGIPRSRDEEFDYCLSRILDGLEAGLYRG
jgi:hypothetical protein